MGAAVGGGKGPRSDINITPLVDVVLVLLIIFMVLTPLLEKELAVRVPEEPDKNQVVPPPPEDQTQYMFKVDAEGKFVLNGNVLTAENGAQILKNAYQQAKANEAKDGPPIVFFDADDKAHYAHAIAALDLIKDSTPQFTIGMMTEKLAAPPPEGGAPAPEAPK